MRKRYIRINQDQEKLQSLLDEYEDIRVMLEKELTETGRAELYTNLNKLITKISDYICRDEEVVRERLGETMGGKVLELELKSITCGRKGSGRVYWRSTWRGKRKSHWRASG